MEEKRCPRTWGLDEVTIVWKWELENRQKEGGRRARPFEAEREGGQVDRRKTPKKYIDIWGRELG